MTVSMLQTLIGFLHDYRQHYQANNAETRFLFSSYFTIPY